MTAVMIILVIAVIGEIMRTSRRIGLTREDSILLWYGKTKRDYIVLWSHYLGTVL